MKGMISLKVKHAGSRLTLSTNSLLPPPLKYQIWLHDARQHCLANSTPTGAEYAGSIIHLTAKT